MSKFVLCLPPHISRCRRHEQLIRSFCTRWLIADLAAACRLLNFLWNSLHYHKTTGLVKCFDNKHTLLYAVRHPAQHTLFTGLQTHDIPASSGTTRYFSHQSFSSGARFKLLNDFLNVYKQLPAVAGNFSLHHLVKNGSGAHPASYPMGTGGSFPGGKAAGAWSWPLTI